MGNYSPLAGLIMLILGTLPGAAQTVRPNAAPEGDLLSSVCSMIETTARLDGLPVDFFTRLIWQEIFIRD